LIRDGIKAVGTLASEGVRTNVTLCFSPLQALLAAKAGAYLISPFIGRLDDISLDGIQLIRDIVKIYDNYGYATQVLAASARSPLHVKEAALAGAHVSTLPYKVFDKMFSHPLTDIGLEKFLADYRRTVVAHA
jgi:transaldolase